MEKVFFTTAIPVGGRSGMTKCASNVDDSLVQCNVLQALCHTLFIPSFYDDGNAYLQKNCRHPVCVMSQLFVLPQGTLCSRLALVSPSSSLSRRRHASVNVPAEIQLKKGAPVRALPPHSRSLKTFLHHLQLLQLHTLFQSAVPPR